jgi:predicted outer membrane protein
MPFLVNSRFAAFAGSIVLAVAAIAVAQNEGQQRPDRPDRPDRPEASRTNPADKAAGLARQSNDITLASCLLIDSQAEIAVAQLAQQRAQDPELKKFAQQLAMEHGEWVKKLHRFVGPNTGASSTSAQPGRDSDLPGAAAPPQPREKSPQATPATPDSRATAGQAQPRTSPRDVQRDLPRRPATDRELDLVSLKRELSEKCLQTAMSELEPKTGREFDKCFIHMQIGAHLHAIDTMLVFQNHVSPELNKVLVDGIQACRGHLQRAKDFAKPFDGAPTTDAPRREKTGG